MSIKEDIENRKKMNEIFRAAMEQERLKRQMGDLQKNRENSANKKAENSNKLWQEVEKEIEKLESGGLEAYNEWMTGMMKIAAACSVLNRAIANEGIISGAAQKIADKTGLSMVPNHIKNKLSDLYHRAFKTEDKELDPGLSVEILNEDGKIQAPKLHATNNKNIKISEKMNQDLEKMFGNWIKDHYSDYSFDSDNGKVMDNRGNTAVELSGDELDDFKKAMMDKDNGFAAYVQANLAEAGFKHNVKFYSKPEEPTVAPSM